MVSMSAVVDAVIVTEQTPGVGSVAVVHIPPVEKVTSPSVPNVTVALGTALPSVSCTVAVAVVSNEPSAGTDVAGLSVRLTDAGGPGMIGSALAEPPRSDDAIPTSR